MKRVAEIRRCKYVHSVFVTCDQCQVWRIELFNIRKVRKHIGILIKAQEIAKPRFQWEVVLEDNIFRITDKGGRSVTFRDLVGKVEK